MKFLIGTKPKTKPFHYRYYEKSDALSLIKCGEPFFLCDDAFYNKVPLILALGHGSCWKLTLGNFQVIGEAIDTNDEEEIGLILNKRRSGFIYGRWYSIHAPEGDIGFHSFTNVTQITRTEFDKIAKEIKEYQCLTTMR